MAEGDDVIDFKIGFDESEAEAAGERVNAAFQKGFKKEAIEPGPNASESKTNESLLDAIKQLIEAIKGDASVRMKSPRETLEKTFGINFDRKHGTLGTAQGWRGYGDSEHSAWMKERLKGDLIEAKSYQDKIDKLKEYKSQLPKDARVERERVETQIAAATVREEKRRESQEKRDAATFAKELAKELAAEQKAKKPPPLPKMPGGAKPGGDDLVQALSSHIASLLTSQLQRIIPGELSKLFPAGLVRKNLASAFGGRGVGKSVASTASKAGTVANTASELGAGADAAGAAETAAETAGIITEASAAGGPIALAIGLMVGAITIGAGLITVAMNHAVEKFGRFNPATRQEQAKLTMLDRQKDIGMGLALQPAMVAWLKIQETLTKIEMALTPVVKIISRFLGGLFDKFNKFLDGILKWLEKWGFIDKPIHLSMAAVAASMANVSPNTRQLSPSTPSDRAGSLFQDMPDDPGARANAQANANAAKAAEQLRANKAAAARAELANPKKEGGWMGSVVGAAISGFLGPAGALLLDGGDDPDQTGNGTDESGSSANAPATQPSTQPSANTGPQLFQGHPAPVAHMATMQMDVNQTNQFTIANESALREAVTDIRNLLSSALDRSGNETRLLSARIAGGNIIDTM